VFRQIIKNYFFYLALGWLFAMVVVSASAQRYDPTRPVDLVPEKQVVKAQQSFELTMIVVRGGSRLAWINGKKVTVGSVIQGMKVQTIETKRVVLVAGSKKIVLQLVAHIVTKNGS
jgi:hypothetical protein